MNASSNHTVYYYNKVVYTTPFMCLAISIVSMFVTRKMYTKKRHNMEPMHGIIIIGCFGKFRYINSIHYILFHIHIGTSLLTLIRGLQYSVYFYFPQYEESIMFSLLQWAEGAAMLGWNFDILLQQVDRFLAVFMHLTYHEVR